LRQETDRRNAMSEPINLTQLRADAEQGDAYIFGWDSNTVDAPILLALIDVAEAARRASVKMHHVYSDLVEVGEIEDGECWAEVEALDDALARFQP
jgi:hypothetical protein